MRYTTIMVTIIRRLIFVIKAPRVMEQQLVFELESQARGIWGFLHQCFRINLMTIAVILVLVLVVWGVLLRFCKMDLWELVNWRKEEMKMQIEGKGIMG